MLSASHNRDLVPRAIERAVNREVARHVSVMEGIGEVARVATDEVSETTTYTAWKGATSMTMVERIRQAAGELSPEQASALGQLESQYLHTLCRLSSAAGELILREVEQPAITGKESFLDWLSEAFSAQGG